MAVKLVQGAFKLYRIDQFGCARCLYGGNTEPKNPSLHILVNNAGIQIEKQVPESTEEDWENVMGTNAKGGLNVCRAIIPVISTRGSIINIG